MAKICGVCIGQAHLLTDYTWKMKKKIKRRFSQEEKTTWPLVRRCRGRLQGRLWRK